MTEFQKVIKYCAIALALLLTVGIIGGILSAVGAVSLFFDGDGVLENMKAYDISGEVLSLKIDIAAADFEICSGDEFKAESNIKKLKVENESGTLVISEDNRAWRVGDNKAKLILYIPDGTVFKNAEIVAGAGRVKAGTVISENLRLVLGAGEFIIENLSASKSADIDGGAGKLQINGGELNNLDLDMGVGALYLQSSLKGNADLDFGVGKTELVLEGSEDDYQIDVDKGLGAVTVEGNSLNGTYGSGNNKIDINGGVGEIQIGFN